MTIVVDASVVVAALIQTDRVGEWALDQLRQPLRAPEHLIVEVMSVIRRLEQHGLIDPSEASSAIADMKPLPIQTLPAALLVDRIWELRTNLTSYDAAYVAAAEALDEPLATLDLRISRAPGVGCEFLLPPT